MKRILLQFDDGDFQTLKDKRDTKEWASWEDFVFELIIKSERGKT